MAEVLSQMRIAGHVTAPTYVELHTLDLSRSAHFRPCNQNLFQRVAVVPHRLSEATSIASLWQNLPLPLVARILIIMGQEKFERSEPSPRIKLIANRGKRECNQEVS